MSARQPLGGPGGLAPKGMKAMAVPPEGFTANRVNMHGPGWRGWGHELTHDACGWSVARRYAGDATEAAWAHGAGCGRQEDDVSEPVTGVVIDYRKAADVPEADVIEAIRYIRATARRWALNHEIAAVLAGNRHLITSDWRNTPKAIYAAQPGIPEKVLLAKLRRMKGRGLIDGCDCGCRGDWVVVGDSDNPYPSPETSI